MAKFDIDRAREAQKAFLDRFGGRDGVQGVGLGMSKNRDSVVLDVLLANEADGAQFPETMLGVPLRLRVVGAVEALGTSKGPRGRVMPTNKMVRRPRRIKPLRKEGAGQ